jgi:hypothetical protein
MTTYHIINVARVDGFGVVQLLEPIVNLPVNTHINVSGLTNSSLNGNSQHVWSVEPYELLEVTDTNEFVYNYDEYRANQVVFLNAGTDITWIADAGTLTYEPDIQWITATDVEVFLGISTATANDTAFIEDYCVPAANEFVYRRRLEAGYHDDPDAVPNNAVKTGTVLYAAMLYRQRGSVDGYASFDQLGVQTPFGSLGTIYQLIGTNRPQVA